MERVSGAQHPPAVVIKPEPNSGPSSVGPAFCTGQGPHGHPASEAPDSPGGPSSQVEAEGSFDALLDADLERSLEDSTDDEVGGEEEEDAAPLTRCDGSGEPTMPSGCSQQRQQQGSQLRRLQRGAPSSQPSGGRTPAGGAHPVEVAQQCAAPRVTGGGQETAQHRRLKPAASRGRGGEVRPSTMPQPAIKAEADAGEGWLGQGPPWGQHGGVADASRTASGIAREAIEDPDEAAGSESDNDAAVIGPRGSHRGESKRGSISTTAAERGIPQQQGLDDSLPVGDGGGGSPVGALRQLLSRVAAAWPQQQQQEVEVLKELSRWVGGWVGGWVERVGGAGGRSGWVERVWRVASWRGRVGRWVGGVADWRVGPSAKRGSRQAARWASRNQRSLLGSAYDGPANMCVCVLQAAQGLHSQGVARPEREQGACVRGAAKGG